MGRVRVKRPSRRALATIGILVAFFAVAAPSCRDYNGGGPTNAIYVLRVSPAVVCHDGMYVVFVRELRDASADADWDGGRDDRVTVFRGTPAAFETDALPVIADETVDFTVDDHPEALFPGFTPRFPDIAGATENPFAVAAMKIPWDGGLRLATGEEIVGQTYTDELLTVGIQAAPPLERGPLGADEIIRPSDPYFDLDPVEVPYYRAARIFPGSQPEGYPTFEDPDDADENVPAAADNCWMFPKTAHVDVRPGVTPNTVDPTSTAPVPFAVLSEPGFDATKINLATLRIGATGPGSTFAIDVDNDGDIDLGSTFVPARAGLPCGATSLTVRGGLTDGPPFKGTDTVVTPACT